MAKLTFDEVQDILRRNEDYPIADCLEWLDNNMSKVPEWAQRNFVPSVIKQAAKKGSAKLSATQKAWMFLLNEEAVNPTPKPEMKKLNLPKLAGLFDSAAENLKWPKLNFQFTLSEELRERNQANYGADLRGLDTLTKKQAALMIRFFESDFNIRLSRAGERSSHPGCIQVVQKGEYGDRKWFGRIIDGVFHRRDDCPQDVIDFLKAFNSKPQVLSQFFGWNSGNCCYCSKLLTDERSLEVGYGPKCAENYSLPWGGKRRAA